MTKHWNNDIRNYLFLIILGDWIFGFKKFIKEQVTKSFFRIGHTIHTFFYTPTRTTSMSKYLHR